jgi:hypothetical protein
MNHSVFRYTLAIGWLPKENYDAHCACYYFGDTKEECLEDFKRANPKKADYYYLIIDGKPQKEVKTIGELVW